MDRTNDAAAWAHLDTATKGAVAEKFIGARRLRRLIVNECVGKGFFQPPPRLRGKAV